MGVHAFPKDICLNVNRIVQQEFELAYYDSALTESDSILYTVLCMGQKALFDIQTLLMQSWVVGNRTVFTSNCVKIEKKTVFKLNWIV